MIQYSDRGKVRIKDLIWYSIVAFPLTSTIKVYVGPLNLILTILLFGLFFYNYYRTQMFKSEFLRGCSCFVFMQCSAFWLMLQSMASIFSVRTWFFTFPF